MIRSSGVWLLGRSFRRLSIRCYGHSAISARENLNQWEAVIGLEIHAQIAAKSKLFSASAAKFAAPVNTLVAFFDAALPGTLPVLNRRCVEAAVQTALALQCKVNCISTFDRKHYFYADLPAGYQITQQRRPLATGGHLNYIIYGYGERKKPDIRTARFVQIQLEQDSGKSLHDPDESFSLIDLNRAGVGLMEIITQPDFRSAIEAASFIKELQLILQTLGTCDGRMEEGSLRVDASVSIHQPNEPLGVRTEIKNLNSIRSLIKAIEYEIDRQVKLVECGGEVLNETRSFDIDSGETVAMRDKEKVHDYRFMDEPNLPPLRLYTSDSLPVGIAPSQVVNVDELRETLPELPAAVRDRLQQQYDLSVINSCILVNEPGLVECFEETMASSGRNAKVTTNILINDVFAALNKRGISFVGSGLTSKHIGELVDMVSNCTVDLSTVRKVVELLVEDPTKSPKRLVVDNDWLLVTDNAVLDTACKRVIANNEKVVADYRRGKTKVFNFLVGQVQKELGGKADAKTAAKILQQLLSR